MINLLYQTLPINSSILTSQVLYVYNPRNEVPSVIKHYKQSRNPRRAWCFISSNLRGFLGCLRKDIVASRRFIHIGIIQSGRFLIMPVEAQVLYFHLCMNADDDGVVDAFTEMRKSNINEGAVGSLFSNEYITLLEKPLVVYINHWKTHNKVREDRI